ncbi:MAG: hypothetical protein JXB30_04110 [Anaerolineae bacterium]|nr:hypothetical protein [Anaerolineae bacterium]
MAGHFHINKVVGRAAAIVIIPMLASCTASLPQWQIYAFHEGTFVALPDTHETITPYAIDTTLSPPTTPTDWDVTAASLADVTGDGEPEWVLLVWRPWRDWPIQEWVSVPSPISDFHDTAGDSCHLILLDPDDEHEVWAGSALPAPLLALAVGDVDGDRLNEVVTLEGDYNAGRDNPASHIDVWAWNDFGFSLKWRSAEGAFHQLELIDSGEGEPLRIAVR